MEESRRRIRLKSLFSESMWSIAGLMLMNLAAQFCVYPVWGRVLGAERYGNVLTLLSFINILSVAVGSGCNYARMRHSSEEQTTNGEYNLCLAAASVLCVPMSLAAQALSGIRLDGPDSILYAVLMCLMLWRYYADVDFRLRLDYKGFFLYYLVISVGYLAGIGLYLLTDLWPVAPIIGEGAGLVYALAAGRVLRDRPFAQSDDRRHVYRVILTLVATNLLLNLIFNADRLLLNWLIDGTAVSVYYLASLLGKTISLVTTPLNSVIIGHAARYEGRLTMKMLLTALGAMAGGILLATGVCWAASMVLIRLLYPDQFEMAREYFLLGNLAQIIYCVTNVLATFLLCFTKSGYQLLINVVYCIAFLAISIPCALLWGLWGFVVGLVFVNVIRFGTAAAIGFVQVRRNEREE